MENNKKCSKLARVGNFAWIGWKMKVFFTVKKKTIQKSGEKSYTKKKFISVYIHDCCSKYVIFGDYEKKINSLKNDKFT